jgi:hypothetical protein
MEVSWEGKMEESLKRYKIERRQEGTEETRRTEERRGKVIRAGEKEAAGK